MSDNRIPNVLGARLRSPLHAFELDKQLRQPAAADGVVLSELPHLGYVILRGRAQDAAFMQAVARVLGQSLPTVPSTYLVTEAGVVQWMSPDEWWLLCSRERRDGLVAALAAALQGLFAQVVDNSGGHAAVRLSGPRHMLLLRHLGPYDFESLKVGQAVSTVMAKATVSVLRTDTKGVVLLFRRSFADYFWRLLTRTARPYGMCMTDPAAHPDPVVTPLLTGGKPGSGKPRTEAGKSKLVSAS